MFSLVDTIIQNGTFLNSISHLFQNQSTTRYTTIATDSRNTEFGLDMLRHFCIMDTLGKLAENMTGFCAKITI